MVHAFSFDDTYLALDVNSDSLYLLDRLSYEAIGRCERMDRPSLIAELAENWPVSQIEEALSEIDALREEGSLFSSWPEAETGPDGGDVIKAMCLNVAHDCNLRCRYCFAGTGAFHGERGLMRAETGKRALDFLVARSGDRRFLEVDFFGGEPLLNIGAVREIVAHGRKLEKECGKTFRFTTTTNGVGLTDDIMDFLNREMNNIVISIDGRPEVHDRMRPGPGGEGSYGRIIGSAREMVRRRGGGDYYIRGTYTRYNLDFASDALWLADQGFEQISLEPVITGESKLYALTEADLPAVFNEYERLTRICLERRRIGRWFSFFHFNVDLSGGPCAAKRLAGCGAGGEYVAVSPGGDLYPCHQFVGEAEWRLGSVYSGIEREDLRRLFRARDALSGPGCAGCWARFHCGGGCAANAWHFNHDIGKPYEMECRIERKRLECALYLAAMEKTANGNAIPLTDWDSK